MVTVLGRDQRKVTSTWGAHAIVHKDLTIRVSLQRTEPWGIQVGKLDGV